MQLAVLLDALDGDDFLAADIAGVRDARFRCHAVDQDSARAALTFAAAVLAARQVELVAQHVQKAPLAVHIQPEVLPVYIYRRYPGHNIVGLMVETVLKGMMAQQRRLFQPYLD